MLHLINHPEAREIEIRPERDGFWMVFRNGWGVSVQWGEMNYADGTGLNAEIAVLVPGSTDAGRLGGDLLRGITDGNSVIGWQLDFHVLKAMHIVSGFSPDVEPEVAAEVFRTLFSSPLPA